MTSKCGPLSIDWHGKGHHWPQMSVFVGPHFPRPKFQQQSQKPIFPATGRGLTTSKSFNTCNFSCLCGITISRVAKISPRNPSQPAMQQSTTAILNFCKPMVCLTGQAGLGRRFGTWHVSGFLNTSFTRAPGPTAHLRPSDLHGLVAETDGQFVSF